MSKTLKVYNQKAEEVGEVKLNDKVFDVDMNQDLLHQAMVAQMSNERQVLAHTKDRSEVSGGGRKPWRQKGTGRARVGTIRSPIWIGGGVTFGPTKNRNFTKNINKKMKRKALLIVLSDKANNENITIMDKLAAKEYKTKPINDMLNVLTPSFTPDTPVKTKSLEEKSKKTAATDKPKADKTKNNKKGAKRSILIVNDAKDEKLKYSARNLVGVKFINISNINILDLLKYRNLILTKNCIKKLEDNYTNKKS